MLVVSMPLTLTVICYFFISPGRIPILSFVYISVHLIQHHLICQFAQFVISFIALTNLEAFCLANMSFPVLLLMSKQLVHVGLQTNKGSLSENCCTSQFVYRIHTLYLYTRCKARPDTPFYSTAENAGSLQFVKI